MADPVSTPRRPFRWSAILDHGVLIAGALFMLIPVYLALTTASHDKLLIQREGLQWGFGDQAGANFSAALFQSGGFTGEITGATMLMNSFILGIGFAIGKIVLSMMAAYAIVYFRLRFATQAFWVIFTTLLLPLEVRIVPSYEVIQGLGLANSYTGLIVPLLASATGTFFFRQFFLSIPEELVDAVGKRVHGKRLCQASPGFTMACLPSPTVSSVIARQPASCSNPPAWSGHSASSAAPSR